MTFDSIEEEERWERHIANLAKMSTKNKRRYSKMLDNQEDMAVALTRCNMTTNKMETKSCTIRDGVVGVRAPYIGNI